VTYCMRREKNLGRRILNCARISAPGNLFSALFLRCSSYVHRRRQFYECNTLPKHVADSGNYNRPYAGEHRSRALLLGAVLARQSAFNDAAEHS